jgi:D-proline reductase (dithiol) PrdB
MPRLERLSEIQRKNMLYFPCHEHASAPWSPLRQALSQSKVALVTTAGLHVRGDRPFRSGDPSYRVIPSHADANDILQSHASIGFDHTAIYRDINIAFPLDRLRELAEQGTVGRLAAQYYSFMGAQRNPQKIIEQSAPEVARRLQDEHVDVVLLTPI